MILNDVGKMVDKIILNYFNNEHFGLDTFQIMPNHVHMIVAINQIKMDTNFRAGTRPAPTSGTIIGEFKSLTTNEYIKNVKENGWDRFDKYLWQRNYHERIIRNEKEYFKIRNYIKLNPCVWYRDRNNLKYNSL